jgi:dienelactone hydrolase
MSRVFTLSFVLLLLPALVAGTAQPAKPAIDIYPEAPLLDESIRLRLSGLPTKKTVTVRAQTVLRGQLWSAQAAFVADEHGKIDISKQSPTAGSYSGADPMGLFWSMEPTKTPPPKDLPIAAKITDPRVTLLTVEIDGKMVASASVKRWLAGPGVRIRDVRIQGLVGKLFEPEKKGRHPTLLVLSGSEGGVNETEAALLASRGYTTFALAYFGTEGLPKELVNISLEYLKKGIDWLKKQDSVDSGRLGVIGGSKGGELALVLAAKFPEFKAVVAYVPSHVVWSGIGGTFQDPSWTYDGKPLPYVATRPTLAFFAAMGGKKPVPLLDLYQSGLKDEEAVRKAIIPVEKINGALLLVSGKDDQMWPSALMAGKVIERLKTHRFAHPYQHLSYEGAGHAIVNAYIPMRMTITAGRFALGGSPEANARAMADSRKTVLRFLKDNLDSPQQP